MRFVRSLIPELPRITNLHPLSPPPNCKSLVQSRIKVGDSFGLIGKYTMACLAGSCLDKCKLDSCSTMLNGQIYNRAILCWLHFTANYLLRLRANPQGRWSMSIDGYYTMWLLEISYTEIAIHHIAHCSRQSRYMNRLRSKRDCFAAMLR